jgi:hypothetical protein
MRGTKSWWRGGLCCAIFLTGAGSGCSSGSSTAETERPGTVQLAVMNAPSDVKCIKVVAAGTVAFSMNFAVAPGASSIFTMPGVSPGSNTFSGEAYSLACASATAATVANWIADPVVATVVSGATTNVTLVMRPAGTVGVGVDFQGGGGGAGIPLGVWNSTNWNNAIWQ